MARTTKVAAVKVKPLQLSQPTQKFTTPKTSIPKSSGIPVVPMHGAMLNAIKQAPKGVLPAALQKYLGGKGQ